ncbi:MAG: hypothetical protein RIB93_27885 [Coleofasciculus sp. D1-CHI-01]
MAVPSKQPIIESVGLAMTGKERIRLGAIATLVLTITSVLLSLTGTGFAAISWRVTMAYSYRSLLPWRVEG